uniref:DUF2252 domain-containing protein n=1 Tax=Arthrobacter flavus TaxID=95172 RepID=UPI0031DF654D
MNTLDTDGRRLRKSTPRSSHGAWRPSPDRPNPLEVLHAQEQGRVAELIPLRNERMGESPFAFFRGAAAVMAADLVDTPHTGLNVQLCGDAHIGNFGVFASLERRLIFDINDFDETLPGPWEWDLKRLVASVEIAARNRGFPKEQRLTAVLGAARTYREAMGSFAAMTPLEVWYQLFDVASMLPEIRRSLSSQQFRDVQHEINRALSKTSTKAARKLTHLVHGQPRIISDPPLVVPLTELVPGVEAELLAEGIGEVIASYRLTLPRDRQFLLRHYQFKDVARKVVGVGSVGTRSWIVLLVGREHGDPLVLQLKQATPAVLEAFLGPSTYQNHGERVIEGQRLIQASGDVLLGWLRTKGLDGVDRDFYVRQLWDWKSSTDLGRVSGPGLAAHSRLCAWTLARAHARTGNPQAIASYLGTGGVFDRDLAAFAAAYADQNEADFAAFTGTRSSATSSSPV